MGAFIFYCPHCNGKLEVDNSWIGLSTNCPSCGVEITFSPPDPPPAPVPTVVANASLPIEADHENKVAEVNSSGDTNGSEVPPSVAPAAENRDPRPRSVQTPSRWRGCFFGRLFVVLAWVPAVAILGGAVLLSIIWYQEYRTAVKRLPEQYRIADHAAALLKAQEAIPAEFGVMVTLLTGPGSVFQLNAADCSQPRPFHTVYENLGDVEASQHVWAEYQDHIAGIKSSFRSYFDRLPALLQQEIARRGQSATPADKPERREASHPVTFQSGDSHAGLYVDHTEQRNAIDKLQLALDAASRQDGVLSAAIRNECSRTAAGMQFILSRLLSGEGPAPADFAEGAPSDRKSRLSRAVNDTVTAALQTLSGSWRIDSSMQRMATALSEARIAYGKIAEKRAALTRHCSAWLVLLWLVSLAAAFAVMVLADFLRAGFDAVDIMRDLSGKWSVAEPERAEK